MSRRKIWLLVLVKAISIVAAAVITTAVLLASKGTGMLPNQWNWTCTSSILLDNTQYSKFKRAFKFNCVGKFKHNYIKRDFYSSFWFVTVTYTVICPHISAIHVFFKIKFTFIYVVDALNHTSPKEVLFLKSRMAWYLVRAVFIVYFLLDINKFKNWNVTSH